MCPNVVKNQNPKPLCPYVVKIARNILTFVS